MSAWTWISTTRTSPAAALERARRRTRDRRATHVERLAELIPRSRGQDISEAAREQLKLRVLDSEG